MFDLLQIITWSVVSRQTSHHKGNSSLDSLSVCLYIVCFICVISCWSNSLGLKRSTVYTVSVILDQHQTQLGKRRGIQDTNKSRQWSEVQWDTWLYQYNPRGTVGSTYNSHTHWPPITVDRDSLLAHYIHESISFPCQQGVLLIAAWEEK